MKIIFNGTSSSGKTSIIKLLPNNIKKISVDEFFHKIDCDHEIKPYQSLYKNKYYTKKEKVDIIKYYLWKYYKSETKKSKNFIIDLVELEQLNLKKYLSINNLKIILLYTNLDNLISLLKKIKKLINILFFYNNGKITSAKTDPIFIPGNLGTSSFKISLIISSYSLLICKFVGLPFPEYIPPETGANIAI
jgi:hypothetical protein